MRMSSHHPQQAIRELAAPPVYMYLEQYTGTMRLLEGLEDYEAHKND